MADYSWLTEANPFDPGFIAVEGYDSNGLYTAHLIMPTAPGELSSPGELSTLAEPPAYSATVPAGHMSCSASSSPSAPPALVDQASSQQQTRGNLVAPGAGMTRAEELFLAAYQPLTPTRRTRRRSSGSGHRSPLSRESTPARWARSQSADNLPMRPPPLRARRRISPAPSRPTSPLESVEGSTAQVVLQSMNRPSSGTPTHSEERLERSSPPATNHSLRTVAWQGGQAQSEQSGVCDTEENSNSSDDCSTSLRERPESDRLRNINVSLSQLRVKEGNEKESPSDRQTADTLTPNPAGDPGEDKTNAMLNGMPAAEQTASSLSQNLPADADGSTVASQGSQTQLKRAHSLAGTGRGTPWHAQMSATGKKSRSSWSGQTSRSSWSGQTRSLSQLTTRRKPKQLSALPSVQMQSSPPSATHQSEPLQNTPSSEVAQQAGSTSSSTSMGTAHPLLQPAHGQRLIQPTDAVRSHNAPLIQPKQPSLLAHHGLGQVPPATLSPRPILPAVPPLGHLRFGPQLPPLAVFKGSSTTPNHPNQLTSSHHSNSSAECWVGAQTPVEVNSS